MSTLVREAHPAERVWANARYREIRFAATADTDVQLVAELAELGGAPVGLGRLVRLASGAVELGGIWTADAARGRGVARAMVAALLDRARDERDVWCVPFDELLDFYRGFGFVDAAPPWPPVVTAKVDACVAQGMPVSTVLLLRR